MNLEAIESALSDVTSAYATQVAISDATSALGRLLALSIETDSPDDGRHAIRELIKCLSAQQRTIQHAKEAYEDVLRAIGDEE